MGVCTHGSGVWVAKQSAVTAAGGTRIWAGVYREVTFGSSPYPSRSPVVRDGKRHCGAGGLFPACRLGWDRLSCVAICVQGWPARYVSRLLIPSWSPVAPDRERTVIYNRESPW